MYLEYIFTDSRFYEPISAYEPDRDWCDRVGEMLGSEWIVHRNALWMTAAKVGSPVSRTQGFKIHVAADVRRSLEQLVAAVKVLKKHGAPFKFVADQRLLELTNSKNFSRIASGKFITAYPMDHAAFVAIAGDLREALRGHEGPYLLTDRPVPGSKCVYYRYGAFQRLQTVDPAGRIIHAVRDPEGNLVEDPREPEYRLPPWIEEPFAEDEEGSESGDLLGGQFAPEAAIQFSNAGGVYKAVDTHSGRPVVIKEARPHTGVRRHAPSFTDSSEALANEFRKLQLVADLGLTPKPVRFFEECGHTFLAQEYIDAYGWLHFFSEDATSLVPFTRGSPTVGGFLARLLPVARSAIEGLRKIHARGLVLGDLSVNNMLVDADALTVTFIDLESAIEDHEPADWRRSYRTPGFVPLDRRRRERAIRSDDWYALGICIAAAILPLQGIVEVGSTPLPVLVDTLIRDAGLPVDLGSVIHRLLEADMDGALAALARCESGMEAAHPESAILQGDAEGATGQAWSGGEIAAGIAQFILQHYRGASAPALWPGSPESLRGSKWGLAYGAAGIAYFLEEMRCPLPDDFEAAARSPALLAHGLDASLYTGLAGIAYWLTARGAVTEGLLALEHARVSPQRRKICNVFSGEAGVGIAALSIHRLSGSAEAFDLASDSARFLLENAVCGADGSVHWENPEQPDRIFSGYSYGTTGIAYFLSQLAVASGEDRYMDVATRALAGVIKQARSNDRGEIFIGSHASDNGRASYWANGAAGIGSVLLRVGMQLSDRKMIDDGLAFLESGFSKYAVLVGQMDGLSGIWDSMIDGALLAGESSLADHAAEILRGLPVYAYRDPHGGLCFPGPQNLKLACDFFGGSAGVGLAALRQEQGGPRAFLDFALPSADLFAAGNRV